MGCKNSPEESNVVASVGSRQLLLNEVIDGIPRQIRPRLTSAETREYVLRWINDEVLYQEGLHQKLDQRPDVQKELEKIKRELIINKLMELALDKQIQVSDGEIQAFYSENNETFILLDDEVRAYHILCETKPEADSIRKRLVAGEDFKTIIVSLNRDTVRVDWDLGYFTRDQIMPEISRVIFDLPVGAYSQPIKSEFGYHILKVVDKKKKGEKKEVAAVKEEIRIKLEEQKRQENYQRFLLQTKGKYKIQSFFQLLESVVLDSLTNRGVSKGGLK
jgi:parvulin-like peptidyl-prolyl isomerase